MSFSLAASLFLFRSLRVCACVRPALGCAVKRNRSLILRSSGEEDAAAITVVLFGFLAVSPTFRNLSKFSLCLALSEARSFPLYKSSFGSRFGPHCSYIIANKLIHHYIFLLRICTRKSLFLQANNANYTVHQVKKLATMRACNCTLRKGTKRTLYVEFTAPGSLLPLAHS